MKLLLDTHLILWFALLAPELTPARRRIIEEEENSIFFSVISIWEVVIKRALQKPGFTPDAGKLRKRLLLQGFIELPFTAEHALAVAELPPLHGDPFDRALIAQAQSEGLTLVTADLTVARYPGLIWKV